jgi:hypothetical protein
MPPCFQMMNMTSGGAGGRNFILPEKKKDQSEKFGNIVQAKHEMGMTKEQREAAKVRPFFFYFFTFYWQFILLPF